MSYAIKLKQPFGWLSLTQQFLLLTGAVLLVGMTVVGNWVGRQIEASSLNRAIAMAAIYVESILAAQNHDWSIPRLDDPTHDALDRVFLTGPLQRFVVRFKFWHPDGTIFYSSNHAQIGQHSTIDSGLAAAFRGEVRGRISVLDDGAHERERELNARLLEVFVPVRVPGHDEIAAVAEFYYTMEDVDRDIREAQQRSWWVVALGTVGMWLLLHGLVRRASNTIVKQQHDLRSQLKQRDRVLAENKRMQERLREAGARSMALNENFVQRTAANLHDGPGQDLALALLRLEAIAETCTGCAKMTERRNQDVGTLRAALNASLDDLRTIASDLRIPPGMDAFSLAKTAERAVRDFERKFEQSVTLDIAAVGNAERAPMAVKIAAYRMIQEALANSWWHARGSAQSVRVTITDDSASIEVSDQGPGFDVKQVNNSGRLGLALLAERVQLLGGSIEIDAGSGHGTLIKARLPLSSEVAIRV